VEETSSGGTQQGDGVLERLHSVCFGHILFEMAFGFPKGAWSLSSALAAVGATSKEWFKSVSSSSGNHHDNSNNETQQLQCSQQLYAV
jgi:hypothetical protein